MRKFHAKKTRSKELKGIPGRLFIFSFFAIKDVLPKLVTELWAKRKRGEIEKGNRF